MRSLTLLLLCALSFSAAPATTRPAMEQQCQALLGQWRDRFADEHMTYVVSPRFVVAGDGGADHLNRYLNQTILAAQRTMHAKYFDRHEPDRPILILLFEAEPTYRRLAKKWLGDEDVSHFGYFRGDNTMVMNVGTGGGTLVHELTHALIRPDFPRVPDWFNEGLGSLHEQCTLANNDIKGLVNWRLPSLQRAIRADKARPLSAMIADPKFYDDAHVGLNYAQARYLLMYLQEKGELAGFYKNLRDHIDEDPTGQKQLETFIKPQSMEEFEKDWRAWVLTLRFE